MVSSAPTTRVTPRLLTPSHQMPDKDSRFRLVSDQSSRRHEPAVANTLKPHINSGYALSAWLLIIPTCSYLPHGSCDFCHTGDQTSIILT